MDFSEDEDAGQQAFKMQKKPLAEKKNLKD
jgi:hypothetical protein